MSQLPPTTFRHIISPEEHQRYRGIYLIRKMMRERTQYSVLLEDDDKFLEQTLSWLYSEGWVELTRRNTIYAVSTAGRECLKKFEERYSEYLKVYDLYSAVDLGAGTFAFAEYFNMDDAQFKAYVVQENWEDLRIAVAEFKGLSPIEIVFMSFINEWRFESGARGWQFDLHSGLIWDEIQNICAKALHADQLGYEDVSSDSVMADIITQGSQLMMQLLAYEDAARKQREDAERERLAVERERHAQTRQREVTTTTVVEEITTYEVVEVYHPVSYYVAYSDPYYISPIWVSPWWI